MLANSIAIAARRRRGSRCSLSTLDSSLPALGFFFFEIESLITPSG